MTSEANLRQGSIMHQKLEYATKDCYPRLWPSRPKYIRVQQESCSVRFSRTIQTMPTTGMARVEHPTVPMPSLAPHF